MTTRAGDKNPLRAATQEPLGFAHPRDEAVHVRVQDQRLTPGVQRREDARLCPKILWVRQQGTQGVADRLQQGPKPTLKP